MDFLNQTIGKYKLIRLIGEGGMAYVYEGVHERLGTRVAVKILNPVLSVNEQIRIRFENEVKLLASLDHPNIIKVIDYDEAPGRLAIIMEYLSGSDLNRILNSGKEISFEKINRLFVQIMSAFQYAHRNGIVHRDIKPSNIFITENDQVKILDFGIAKIYGTGADMTSTGTQMGTPVYMSPEQVKGDRSIDHRSDIYSLGVTFFTMLNGKPPYDTVNTSQFEIFNQIVYQALPALSRCQEFEAFIAKAVQKDRELRYQSIDEMMIAFDAVDPNAFSSKTKTRNTADLVRKGGAGNSSERDSKEKDSQEGAKTAIDNPKNTDTNNQGNSDSDNSSKRKKKLIKFFVTCAAIVFLGFIVIIVDGFMFNGSLNRKYEWWQWSRKVDDALPCSDLYNLGIKIDHDKNLIGYSNKSKIAEFYIDKDFFDEAIFILPTDNILYINEPTKLDKYGEPVRVPEGASKLYLDFNIRDGIKYIPDGIYTYSDTLNPEFTFSHPYFGIQYDGSKRDQKPQTELEITGGTIEVKRCQINTYFLRFDLICANDIKIKGVFFGEYKGFE